jgi:hypothetical protein
VSPGEPRQVVGPTWLLGPVIRGAAGEAVDRLHIAVSAFAEAIRPPTPDEVRLRAEAASALVATLIALDHVENYAVENA